MLSQPVVLKRFYGDVQSVEDRLLESFLLPEERGALDRSTVFHLKDSPGTGQTESIERAIMYC